MEILTIFLLLGITFLVLIYISIPLLSKNFTVRSNDSAHSHLLAERERILNILVELDFDHKLGKIPDGDYASQREELISKGGIVMEKIDLITKSKNQSEERQDDNSQLSDKDIERLLNKRRAQKNEVVTNLCPECSKPILQSDRFCPSCGKKINPETKIK